MEDTPEVTERSHQQAQPPQPKTAYQEGIAKYIIPGLVSLAVSLAVAFFNPVIQRSFQRPSITIEGMLPVHLFKMETFPGGAPRREHQLALIFKVVNDSPTDAIVHLARITGCVKMGDPHAAEINLPSKERVDFSGKDITFAYERHKHTVQKISDVGIVRQDSQVVPKYGTAYVGVLFPFPAQGAFVEATRSVSLQGKCDEIKVANTQPSLSQIFDIGAIYRSSPKGLRSEFRSGQYAVTLFVGNDQVRVATKKISQLTSIPEQRWSTLGLAAMYENPNVNFPPITQ
jgi:hypothetical protein